MKKFFSSLLFSSLLFVLLPSISIGQSGAKWSENGDAFAAGAFIGTTNNEPLLLKANNNLGLKIKPNGELIFKSLDLNSNNGPNGIVFTDGQGKIFRLNLNGDGNQILLGNGTWGSSPKTFWLNNGITNDIYFNSGKVGIGTATPQYNLDVIGDARVSNNLYVGGGIVITDRVQASSDVKTQTLNADSILLGAGRSIYGETKVEGDIKAMFKLDVSGDSRFLGKLTASQGFMLDPTIGFRLLPTTQGQPQTIAYGKVGTTPNPFFATCLTPGAPFYSHQFGGGLQIYETDVNGNFPSAAGSILSITAWNGATSIDLSGGTPNSSLLIDYFCGRNTLINVGPNGGTVGMGKIVEIGMPSSNSNVALNLKANGSTAISVENSSSAIIHKMNNVGESYFGSTTNPTLYLQPSYDLGTNSYKQGNVGIGTSNPLDNLDIVGRSNEGAVLSLSSPVSNIPNKRSAILFKNINYSYGMGVNYDPIYGNTFQIFENANPGAEIPVMYFQGGRAWMGKKPIGNRSNALFSVYGEILCKALYVNVSSSVWADYVFNSDYQLMPILDVEKYYTKNKHLPGVPNAEEMEEKGDNVVEIDAMLLKKIEEQTIYIVQLKKELELLRKDVDSIKK